MGTKRKRKNGSRIWLILVFAVTIIFSGCAGPQKTQQKTRKDVQETQEDVQESQQETQDDSAEMETDITIWLDAENDFTVRDKVSNYKTLLGSSIIWKLVDKSYLTKEQYKQEFLAALEEGTAPDLIYMDTYNGLNPKELMENGMLYGMTAKEFFIRGNGGKIAFIDGAQDIVMQDEKYYILPLFMECPIVFGLEEDLKEAGIETAEMYGSLDDFLEGLLEAQEKTGKLIFENTKAVDWLETYYMPKDAAQAENVQKLLARVRECCGNNISAHGAYRMLDNKECLLGGCGMADYRPMCEDLFLFDEEQKPVVLAVPDSSGELKGVVTHAVAINAKTAHLEEAIEALKVFKNSTTSEPDLCVLKTGLSDAIYAPLGILFSAQKAIAAKADKDELFSDGLGRILAKYCYKETIAASYAQEYEDRAEAGGHTHPQGTKTLYVHYPDCGDGEEYPYTVWLDKAAKAYESTHEGIHIQFTTMREHKVTFEIHEQEMLRYDTAPDIMIFGVTGLQPDAGVSKADIKSPDFTSLFEKYREALSFLPENLANGIVYENGVTTLPITAEEFGIWYSRSALKKAGLPEDWEPKDMAELTEGLERLNGLSRDGNPYTAIVQDIDLLKALSMFAETPEELLKLQEDKSWALSVEAWKEYLSYLTDWRDRGLVEPAEYYKKDVLDHLADGSIGAYIGSSTFLSWIDGNVVPLTEEQKEDLAFVQLSPAADMQMFFVPLKSEHAEDAFLFWLEAMRQPEYEKFIKQNGYVPVTELPDDIISLPNEEGNWKDMGELLQSVWNSEMTAEELAEKYQWYEFAEE